FLFEPIGRRGLVEQTSFTERYIRNEIELLQMQGLIKVTTQGMYITDDGKLIINNLDDFIREVSRITSIENKLKKLFNIEHIRDVIGDIDKDLFVKDEFGRAAVSFLKKMVEEKKIIAVTTGTTIAAV